MTDQSPVLSGGSRPPEPPPGGGGRRDDSDADTALASHLDRQAERTAAWRERADRLAERYRDRPVVDLGLRVHLRDRESAGAVLGSALAFRLFLFFVPLLLFVVGLTGFLHGYVDESTVEDAGIAGSLAAQIETALNQPNATRWSAVLLGLFGMATAGRTLSKVLVQLSCVTWRLPLRRKAPVKVVGGLIGLIVGVGVIATLINRIRQQVGLGVMSVSFLAVFGLYALLWLLVMMLLPRVTTDPGALLPGALLNAAVLTGLQVVSQLFLAGQFERASTLYGAFGTTVVTLGWFFFVGRTVVLSMALNAAVYERFGSISGPVFRLPVLRALPRRWPRFQRFFQLDDPGAQGSAGDETAPPG